jgi:amino acid transporter
MRGILPVYAMVNTALYSVLCLTGAFVPSRFLVSFDLIVLFTVPSYLILFAINTARYYRLRQQIELALMVTWLSLGVVMAAYYIYLALGYSAKLWEKGIWFTENDVLHVGLILWMLYIGFVVAKKARDSPVRT